MKLEQVVHAVEGKLLKLLGDETREQLRQELVGLDASMATLHQERSRLIQEKADLVSRLEKNLQAAVLLPSQIESSVSRGKHAQAMRQSLELERIRKELESDRENLPKLEQAVWSLNFRLRQLQRQWHRIHAMTDPS